MNYISLGYKDLLIALMLILIPVIISFQSRLKIEKDILIATVRTFIQLIVIGYVLKYIFNLNKWYYVLLMVFIMALIAGYNAVKRQKIKIPHLYELITLSIFTGAFVAMVTLIFLILRVSPWYEPQYLIPVT